MSDELMDELSPLLKQPLDPARWEALCLWLDRCPHALHQRAFELIQGSRARHPSSRLNIVAPARWLDLLRGGHWPPWLALLAPDLDLYEQRLGPTGAKALAQAPQLLAFYRLALESNALGAQGAQILAESAYLGQLVELNLADNGLGDQGIDALSQASFPALELLILRDNELGLAATQHLVAWSLPSLTLLNLSENHLDDQAAHTLLEAIVAKGWEALDYLNLLDNPISEQGKAQLRALALKRQGLELDI